jgi:FkbM family methyltransferase
MIGSFEIVRKNAKAVVVSTQPAFYWWYRKLLRGWAEKEMALMSAFCPEGSNAIDIGANHGLFTHYLAGMCAHVHAFEASPRMAEVMRKGYLRRGNVTVHEVALSNVQGTATLQVPTFVGLSGYATLEKGDLASKVKQSCELEQIPLETRRLDDFAVHNVGFIKVDVEGHEQEVLEGASETLKREPAIVLAELEERHRPNAVRDVAALMASLGYRAFFLRDRQLLGLSHFDPQKHQDERDPQGKDYVRNFLFVAKARLVDLPSKLAQHGYTMET